jgi:hypothetical protein
VDSLLLLWYRYVVPAVERSYGPAERKREREEHYYYKDYY